MRRFALLALGPIIASSVLLTGCFELDGLVLEDFGIDSEEAPDLTQDPDPEVQAAAESSQEIDQIRESNDLMQTALNNNQLDAALEAVELRPSDAHNRLLFASLLLANDDLPNAREEVRAARDILIAEGLNEAQRLDRTMVALLQVRATLDEDSEAWQRVNKEYCGVLKAYRRLAPEQRSDIFDTAFGAVVFPDDTCP